MKSKACKVKAPTPKKVNVKYDRNVKMKPPKTRAMNKAELDETE